MTDEELLAIIRSGAESRNWDFKGPMAWQEKDGRACCSLVKDLIAFANSGGGFLILGVDNKTRQPIGLTDEQVQSFDETRVARFVNRYAAPPIGLTVRRVPDPDEQKRYVAIMAPAFPNTPHICQKDYPAILTSAGLYIRNANMETVLVTDPADMSELIERCIRNRSDALLRDFDVILRRGVTRLSEPADEERFQEQVVEAMASFEGRVAEKEHAFLKDVGWVDVVCHPSSFNEHRFQDVGLRQAVEHAAVYLAHWTFPHMFRDYERTYVIDGGLETFSVYYFPYKGLDFWQCRESALFVDRAPLREDSDRDGESDRRILFIEPLLDRILHAVAFIGNLYGSLGLPADEPVKLALSLSGCKGRLLAAADPLRWLPDEYMSHVETVHVERLLTVAEWRAKRDPVTIQMTQEVLHMFNCDDISDSVLQELIDKYVSGKL